MVIFLDNLDCMLLHVGNVHIPRALKEEPGLSTNIGGTATLTWSLDQVIIVDSDRYFYLKEPSLLWLHLLDSLHTSGQTTNQHLITKSFHATATSTLLSAENGYTNTHQNPGDAHPANAQIKLKSFIFRRSLPSRATSTIKRGCSTRTRCLAKGGSDVTRLMGLLPSPGQWGNRGPGRGYCSAAGTVHPRTVAPPPLPRCFLPSEGIEIEIN
jgi:hypothetical protein